jgi:signal transduction histidine kinase
MTERFRSATFKLTMWYLAIVMAISFLFSVILYHDAGAELARGIHRESLRISTQFPVFQNNPMLNGTNDYAEATHHLLLRLIAFNILVLVTAGLASYLLARRTLSPIEQAQVQQQRFTADVSHELRTPLTALRMESEVALLNDKASSSELRTTLVSNLEEVAKLESLINNLLRLTHLEEAELRHNFTAISTRSIVDEAVGQVAKAAEVRGITLSQTVTDGQLNGDHDSLVQLLVILLDNAIKYSHGGGEVQLVAESGTLRVSDSGAGIDADALEHIFERFYRADTSRNKTTTEGYGLGLSIAKMIADIHHADITLASQPGQGTTATVTFPNGVAH